MILHVDMDAFFASIEQAINPQLKGKPLIVGSRDNPLYTVVCAASYEAKALGINSGISSKEAFQKCPQLQFVAADQSKYIWTSEQILELLKGYGLIVHYASIDEFQIELEESLDYKSFAQDIQMQIYANFNITASIGIAKNCLLAKLASKLNKPNGITMLSETNTQEILKNTPVEKLCGIGKASEEKLHNIGIRTCLELYQKTPRFLERIFGKNGLHLYASLHSQESLDSIETPQKPKSISHSYTLPRASQNPGFIQAWLRLLSEMVAERLRQQNLTAQTIHLWLNGPEIGNFSSQKTFQQTADDGYEIYHNCLKIMARTYPKTPRIRALGITASNLRLGNQEPLFNSMKRRQALLQTMDKINSRFGEGAIFPAVVTFSRKQS